MPKKRRNALPERSIGTREESHQSELQDPAVALYQGSLQKTGHIEDAKDNPILFRRDQSDSDGSFTLYNIIPGRYRLLAIDPGWDLEWSDPNVLSAFLKKSIPLQVHENDHLNQMVEVQSK